MNRIGIACLLMVAAQSAAWARGASPYLPLNLSPEIERQIERVLILAEDTGPIRPAELEPRGDGEENPSGLALGPQITALALREARELFEREYLVAQIARFGGNISRTAQFVGMERSALHRKLKSLGVVGGVKGEEDGE